MRDLGSGGVGRRSVDLDRAAGALVGLAAGDALGAGYEFSTPTPAEPIRMRGGGLGPWEPGEWTDDTQQAVCIAEVAATDALNVERVGGRFLDWLRGGPKDVGVSTRAVLSAADGPSELADAAVQYFASHPQGAAGNGSLMRTSPVALAHLGDDEAIRDVAMEVSALTHGDPLAGEACVLWCIAIDRAVRDRRLDGVRDGLAMLPSDRAAYWSARLDEAEARPPSSFTSNGFVVTALQAAYAAITQTPVPADRPCRHLQHALEAAVQIGHDTDTVAAIAGQLLGARWGVSAIPWTWRQRLYGWPGMTAADLVRLAVLTARGGNDDAVGWPSTATLVPWGRQQEPEAVCVASPDDGLLLGNLHGLPMALEQGVEAVVSLCRVGRADVPDSVEHVSVWLVDQDDANANVDFVIDDTVDAIRTLRQQGKRVFLHCVGGRSRTPTVAAAYLADRDGGRPVDHLSRLPSRLPRQNLNPSFVAALERR